MRLEPGDIIILRHEKEVKVSRIGAHQGHKSFVLPAGQVLKIKEFSHGVGMDSLAWVRTPESPQIVFIASSDYREAQPLELLAAQAVEWLE